MIGHFHDGRALLRPAVNRWGGNAPLLGSFETDAGSAAFIASAKQRIRGLEAAANAIGPPRVFDFGSNYGEKWDPLNSAVQALIADAQAGLRYGSPERAEMMKALNGLNQAIFKVRSEASSDAYKLALAAITMNPALAMDAIVRTAQSAGGLAADAGRAASDLAQGGCSLWRAMGDPAGFWRDCVPWYAKWGAAALVGLKVASMVGGRR